MGPVSGSTKPPAGSASAGGRAPPRILAPVGVDAPTPAMRTATSDRVERLVEALAAEIVMRHATGNRVLDFGHGSPRVTDWVAPRASQHSIIDAVDLGRGGEVSVPMPDATFDLVYCLRTLPHLGHDAETSDQAARSALREIARLLGPGGVALVQIDNPMSLYGAWHGLRRLAKALERGPLVFDSPRGLTRFDSLPRLLGMLPSSLNMTNVYGLRVVAVTPALLALPVIGRIFERMEWWARDRPALRRLGAHLLIEVRRLSRLPPGEDPAQSSYP